LATSLSDYKFKLVFAAWWLIWSGLNIIVLIDYGLPLNIAITDSLIGNILLASMCLLISNNMHYYLPRQEKYWYILSISLGLSAIWLLIVRVLLWLLFKNNSAYMLQWSQSSNIRYGIAFLMTGCMSMLSLVWYSQQEQKGMDERKIEAEKMAKDAELYKLRQQLQPHFLFNSLNSISALTGTQPEKARFMIQQLSDFLRGTLKKEEQQWSTLNEEFQYLQLYLDIEKVRFGHRLQTRVIFEEDNILQLKLPAMLLQPAVENAIKFGLYDTIGEVMIAITALQVEGSLQITIQNPFDPETSLTLQGTGFGLASIQRRLYLLFGRHDLLQTKEEKNQFITTILIPQGNLVNEDTIDN
jgi:two-component system LytT family sensor kinase